MMSGYIFICLLGLLICLSKGERFEAENAYASGNCAVVTDSSLSDSKGSHMELQMPLNSNDIKPKLIFAINSPHDGYYPIQFAYSASDMSAISIHGNGIELFQALLPKISTWGVHVESLWLREGLNTLIIQLEKSSCVLRLDYIEIQSITPNANRGATVSYYEMEAELAETNGIIIGPNRTYMSLPSEASGRMAVQLNSTNHFVEFTLTSPANGVVVRFSIPDSDDGYGLNATLGINIVNSALYEINITSRFSWIYGIYPFSNTPSDGEPHHFYDDTRFFFNETLPTGTKLRLVPLTEGITYTIDLIDLYTVPPAYSIPTIGTMTYLSVTDYGADATGLVDSTKAFLACLNDSLLQGKGVWIPQGRFLVRSTFTVNSTIVRGAGPWYSDIFTDVPTAVGFYGLFPYSSQNVGLYDFSITGATVHRNDSLRDYGIGGSLSNSIIQNLWIQHTKCGMWLGAQVPYDGLYISGVTIRNTFADGINFYRGATNCIVEQTVIRNTGDDGLAMWGYIYADVNSVFRFNTVQLPMLANGIVIYGGINNSATDNLVYDIVVEGGAFQISNRFSGIPFGGTTIHARNTGIRGGAWDRAHAIKYGGLVFWAQTAHMTATILVDQLELYDCTYSGILFVPSLITMVNITNTIIDGVGIAVMEVIPGTEGSIYVSNLTALSLPPGGGEVLRKTCSPVFDIIQGPNNVGWNDSTCPSFSRKDSPTRITIPIA